MPIIDFTQQRRAYNGFGAKGPGSVTIPLSINYAPIFTDVGVSVGATQVMQNGQWVAAAATNNPHGAAARIAFSLTNNGALPSTLSVGPLPSWVTAIKTADNSADLNGFVLNGGATANFFLYATPPNDPNLTQFNQSMGVNFSAYRDVGPGTLPIDLTVNYAPTSAEPATGGQGAGGQITGGQINPAAASFSWGTVIAGAVAGSVIAPGPGTFIGAGLAYFLAKKG
jgi:hypothetical protein